MELELFEASLDNKVRNKENECTQELKMNYTMLITCTKNVFIIVNLSSKHRIFLLCVKLRINDVHSNDK